MRELKAMKVAPIDMVVVQLLSVREGRERPRRATDEKLIENIDIGGPSMVRASTKNYLYVTVVPSPRFYGPVLEELGTKRGRIGLELRRSLAVEAFAMTAAYDSAIYNGLWRRFSAPSRSFPGRFLLSASKYQDAKYGENPDQKATIYSIDGSKNMTAVEAARRRQRSPSTTTSTSGAPTTSSRASRSVPRRPR